ncbi:hypothetical protein CRG98_015278 [Punica granatum]|uniref:Uncharacterized protein n=1 Tax=Punica granatum TaxID=22663 RepID=A0A2I0K6Z7_PUNGR|nr:hypothetical protein CRG98_015278 [Punica granatum]
MRGRSPKVGPKPNEGPEPDVRPKPNAVNAGREPDAGSELEAGPKPNEGPEPDVRPKPNAVNAGREPDAGSELEAGPKPNAVNACSIRKCKRCKSKGMVKAASGLPAKVDTNRLSFGVGGRAGRPLVIARLAMERGEDRKWSTREGYYNSHVVRDGWPGWTASGHSTSRHGEVKTASGLPAKVITTHMSYGTGGRDGRPLVIARLAMER